MRSRVSGRADARASGALRSRAAAASAPRQPPRPPRRPPPVPPGSPAQRPLRLRPGLPASATHTHTHNHRRPAKNYRDSFDFFKSAYIKCPITFAYFRIVFKLCILSSTFDEKLIDNVYNILRNTSVVTLREPVTPSRSIIFYEVSTDTTDKLSMQYFPEAKSIFIINVIAAYCAQTDPRDT